MANNRHDCLRSGAHAVVPDDRVPAREDSHRTRRMAAGSYINLRLDAVGSAKKRVRERNPGSVVEVETNGAHGATVRLFYDGQQIDVKAQNPSACDLGEPNEDPAEPEPPDISVESECSDDGAESTVTLNNPDNVTYPVDVQLKVQGTVVGEVTFEEGETEQTTTLDISAADLDDGRVVNVFVNGDRADDLQDRVQCDQESSEPNVADVRWNGCGTVFVWIEPTEYEGEISVPIEIESQNGDVTEESVEIASDDLNNQGRYTIQQQQIADQGERLITVDGVQNPQENCPFEGGGGSN